MQAPASVCPGYNHVEAFSNDEDYYESDEEEVSYITLDLGDVEPQLVPNASTYRLIVRFCGLVYHSKGNKEIIIMIIKTGIRHTYTLLAATRNDYERET